MSCVYTYQYDLTLLQQNNRPKRDENEMKEKRAKLKLPIMDGAFCILCKSNKEPIQVYRSHTLKDKQGKVMCPILR